MLEDRGGILTVVGGLVALTVVATGLAMVMEKRSDFSKRRIDAEKTVAEDHQILELLKDDLDRANERWGNLAGRASLSAKYEVAKAVGAKRTRELEQLRQRHQGLKEDVAALDGDFTKYQREYLRSIRTSAEGEELGVLRLKSGREYLKVTITRVTADGLDIRHESGSARVSVADLDDKWNERFLWR